MKWEDTLNCTLVNIFFQDIKIIKSAEVSKQRNHGGPNNKRKVIKPAACSGRAELGEVPARPKTMQGARVRLRLRPHRVRGRRGGEKGSTGH
jgi:hypothetical protein